MKWMPLEEGTLKINADEVFLHDDGTGATGVVMCGSDGRLRARLVGSTWLARLCWLR